MSSLSGPERRRYPRYRVRLRIQFLRGEAEVAAEIFNISRSGCLLVTPVAMQVGERVEVFVPALGRPPQAFKVIRTRSVAGSWHAVAADFEPYLPDDAPLLKLRSQDEGPHEDPEQIF
ncbi:PilZ domain-containing protein [Archangium lansingense]|uniref:PilZ domain-containing protein n=1 Tax=Archangium lansingense TaxID=2995310 RepID=A0ABT4A3H8_9BACT|nr:PilZ domain-containing protein [Archangium lansinium]MCY1076199.1 PilZ domain-containing protein [Archangium lansinium]